MINDQITVIIPIHDIKGKDFKKYFEGAISSLQNSKTQPGEVLLVYPNKKEFKETMDKDYSYGELNVRHVTHNRSTSYQSQINIGVENVNTPYFSMLEFDDEYSSIWFDNVTKYIEHYPDVDIFLPIISDVNEENEFIGYSNEVAWALNFSNEIGFLDHDTISDYPNINIDGLVIKTDLYRKSGGLKESIRLSFNYEFLLRFTNLGYKVMVIPKIGYKHVNMREGSIFWNYRHNPDDIIMPDEAKFWMKTAKEEFYHKKDRGITYVINETLNA